MNDGMSGTSAGYVGFLFGIFCAYWAQVTHRNAWIWFFFGWILAPVAGLTLLWKNAADFSPPPRLTEHGREDLLAIRKDIP